VRQQAVEAHLRKVANDLRTTYLEPEPKVETITAKKDGKQIGFLEYGISRDGQVLHINNTNIDRAYRGQGYATQLFDDVVKVARERGIKKITLAAVEDGMLFWAKKGFDLPHEAMPNIGSELERRFNSILLPALPQETNVSRIFRSVLETNSEQDAENALSHTLDGQDMFLNI
jgi:predicted GNAT family acetyltransferase